MTADRETRAWELERERLDAELAELRERVRGVERYVGTLQEVVTALAMSALDRERHLHSVKVQP